MDNLWRTVGKANQQILRADGLNNFKQTITGNYFQCTYSGIRSPFTLFLVSSLPKAALLKIIFRRKKLINFKGPFWRKLIHKMHLAMLFEYAEIHDKIGLLSVEEPELGNPTMFTYKGKSVSIELLISVIELNSLQLRTGALKDGITILEIGAGYGRLAHLIQSFYTDVKYNIIDIPETLEVSRSYLSKVLPNSDIRFHDAFAGFPKGSFDLIIAIANLPEMELNERESYIENVAKSCTGYFYNKQEWVRTNISNDITTTFVDYAVNGKLVSVRPADYTPEFFEAIYKF